MQGSHETRFINAPQAVEEHQYAVIEDDYISVIGDDCQDDQDHRNQLEGEYLTPIRSYHQDHQERGQTQVSIKLPHKVPQQRCCKQPPWWAWLLMGIGIGVLLFGAIMVGTMMPSPMNSSTMIPCPMNTSALMPSSSPSPAVTMSGPKDCQQVYDHGHHTSGVYRISSDDDTQWNVHTALDVFCEQQLDGGGWLVFQARKDGSVDFYQNWNTYKAGFGNLTGEFWLGNANIHLLTKHLDQQLKVELTRPVGKVQYADYSHFSVGDASQQYRLDVTGYSGADPPGDSMAHSNGYSFSTVDRDNDGRSSGSCATIMHGAWWYGDCTNTNLNGRYGGTGGTGLNWYHWKGHTSMRATRMMLRKRP